MTITLERDDWIPLLENAGVAVMLTDVARYHPTIDDLRTDLNRFCIDNGIEMQGFSPAQIQQLVADLVLAGKLVGSEIAEGSNVEGIERAAAPSAATVAGAVLDEALGAHDGWLTTLLTAAGYTAPANSDIATILEDTAALIERLTEARAGYLDLLNTYLDAAVSGAVAPTVEEINTKLETEHGAGSWGAQGAYTITPTTPLTDSVTGNPISGMTVKIYSNALRTETYLITEVKSDTEGSFTAHVTASGTYYLRAIKEGYTTIEWTEVAA